MSLPSVRSRRLRSPVALLAAFGICAAVIVTSLGGCTDETAAGDAEPPYREADDAAVVAYDPTKSLAPMLAAVGPAVVSVLAEGVASPQANAQGTGSGFVVHDSGLVVTNDHVIANARAVKVRMSDGRRFDAEIVGRDPATDLALLRLAGADDLPAVVLGHSGALAVGDWVVAVGNPMGLQHSATVGIVSGKGRGSLGLYQDSFIDFLQTDADIAPGSSGGPLFDLEGRVVGIATAVGGGSGPGFAIPIDQAKRVITQLREHGTVSRGWLGAASGPDDDAGEGAVIGKVFADTPAARAGLRVGDVIVAIEGERITSFHELRGRVATTAPGTRLELTVRRGDDTHEVDVELLARPDADALASLRDAPPDADDDRGTPDHPLDRFFPFGARQDDARPRLGASVKASDDGITVVDVQPGSLADRLGLRPGDRIVEIDGAPVHSGQDIRAAWKKIDRTIAVAFVRDGKRHEASYESS